MVKVREECMHQSVWYGTDAEEAGMGCSSSQCKDSRDVGPFLSEEPKDSKGSSLGQKT